VHTGSVILEPGLTPENLHELVRAGVWIATGSNARVYRLNTALLAEGRDTDSILLDTCAGGAWDDPLTALTHGDIPAVRAVFSGGVPRFVGCSRNTPPPIRSVRVASCRLAMDFSGAGHLMCIAGSTGGDSLGPRPEAQSKIGPPRSDGRRSIGRLCRRRCWRRGLGEDRPARHLLPLAILQRLYPFLDAAQRKEAMAWRA